MATDAPLRHYIIQSLYYVVFVVACCRVIMLNAVGINNMSACLLALYVVIDILNVFSCCSGLCITYTNERQLNRPLVFRS